MQKNNQKTFLGCLIFKTSCNHYKKNSNILLSVDDYKTIKSFKEGKRSIKKYYDKRMFIKKIIISKKIERSDTTTSEYRRIEAI